MQGTGNAMRQIGEPSVEEILESIKKVIARDQRTETGRTDSGRTESARTDARRSAAGADVLDLGEIAEVLAADRQKARAESVRHAATETARTRDDGSDDCAHEPFGAQDFSSPDSDGDDDMADQNAPLLPETTTASMRESLAALAILSEPGAQPQIVRSGETSLEGLVRDMLRPMLAEWLEKNLPPMVEKMVGAEIARIVGKRG